MKRRKIQSSAGSDTKDTQIQQVKEKIKVLCTQTQPSEALILLSLDELSRLARKLDDDDMDMYEELYRQCSRMQGKINMGNLCLTVLGGKGADTVTKAINKCLKEVGTGTSEGKLEKNSSKEDNQTSRQESILANLYPPLPMYPMGFPHPYSYMSHYGGGYRSFRPQGQVRPFKRQNIGKGTCLFCESTSHYVKDCELMKQAKKK